MAKDPAFLFYTNDFDSKTKFFTHEQVGFYLRLLMAQHQNGHLTEKQMIFICGRSDEEVFSKFIKDESGLFYSERLEEEINRRKKFVQSRSDNRSGKTKEDMIIISKTYEKHTGQRMEIENENTDIKRKNFEKPTVEQLFAYFREINMPSTVYPQKFLDHYESNGWKVGANKMKDWKAACRTWKNRTKEEVVTKQYTNLKP